MRRRIWVLAVAATLVVASVVGYAVVTSAGEAAPAEILADPDTILWDTVMIWPPGVHWADLSAPSFHGEPVVEVSDRLADEIRAAARR